MTPRPIGDDALLSDCHSAVLVGSDGSIDWACLRRFDRPSTFAHLLDAERGGRYHVVLHDGVVRDATLVLDAARRSTTRVVASCSATSPGRSRTSG